MVVVFGGLSTQTTAPFTRGVLCRERERKRGGFSRFKEARRI